MTLQQQDLDILIHRIIQTTGIIQDYLSPKEIASLLKVSPISVRRWIQKGLIKSSKIDGGSVRVKRTDFLEFCKEIEQA